MATSTKAAKRNEFKHQVNGYSLLGEIITWSPGKSQQHKHKDVIAALKASSLDEQVARAIMPKQAFARASKKLTEERLIDVIREDTDSIVFQFTKKAIVNEEWHFKTETKLTLDKVTGKVACKNLQLQEKAQAEVDRCIEMRTASDITRIVQKLFEDQADLFAIRNQGGAYFVPNQHSHFSNKVQEFLINLGGSMGRFPIPAGTQMGDMSVKEAVASGLQAMIQEYEDAVNGFGNDTRDSTLQTSAERIRNTKIKIEAYSSYLGDRQKKLEKDLTSLDDVLRKKIEKISQYKTDPNRVREEGGAKPGITDVILGLLRKAGKDKKPISKQEILEILVTKFPNRPEVAMKRTVNGQIHYNLEKNKGIRPKHNGSGGFWIEK